MGRLESTEPRELIPELAAAEGHVIWRAAARVTQALTDEVLAGVDIHEYAALVTLAEGPARSQQWLADSIGVSRTTLSRLATDLVDRGLVRRERNPEDRRSYVLERTPYGADLARTWRRYAEELETALTPGFDDAERDELRELLVTVTEPFLSSQTTPSLRRSTGFLVSKLHFRLHVEASEALRDLDLEPRHMGTFILLDTLGPLPQAELARHLGVSGPSVVEMVDSLEGRGLVERRRAEHDRRTQLVHPRPGAAQVAQEARERLTAVTDAALTPLSAREHQRLVRLLVRFVRGG